jgi:hypothetical protein
MREPGCAKIEALGRRQPGLTGSICAEASVMTRRS